MASKERTTIEIDLEYLKTRWNQRWRWEFEVKREAESIWKWVEGVVNTVNEHFKTTYKGDPEPIALVLEGVRPVLLIRVLNLQGYRISSRVNLI